jgi:opacity protein-like surface antigen
MRLKVAVAALAMMLSAGAASAQIWIGPTGGFTFPMGDFGDVSNTGFHLGVTGDYALMGGFSIGGDILWHRSTGKDDYEKALSALNGVPTDVTFDIVPITVHGKFAFPGQSRYQPYLKAGLGIYHTSSKIDAGSAGSSSRSDNNFGVNIGGGTSILNRGSMNVGVEGALHFISSSGSSTNLLTVSATALFGRAKP